MPAAADNPSSAPPPRRDRRAKLVLLTLTVAVAAGVWWAQRDGGQWDGWGNDLQEALRQSAAEGRPVLVLFTSDPMDYESRRMKQSTLASKENRQAVRSGRYIPVVATAPTALTDERSRRYELARLPTMLVIAPGGRIVARAEGFVGEQQFRQQFLPRP